MATAARCWPARAAQACAQGVPFRRPWPQPATAARHVWAYDFVFDARANGQQLNCLTVIDEYTRECLAIDIAGSIRSKRVIEVLPQLASVHGVPRYLRSDNGPEFVSHAILKWAAENGMEMAPGDPGKSWQNGADESFNGKFRDECLSLEWFRTRAEAKVVIEQRRRNYNAIRPAGSRAPPAVWYQYSPARKSESPREHLAGYSGILQADAYGG
ncbi:transposase InsO family protein [Paraburkholderia sp. GAS448]